MKIRKEQISPCCAAGIDCRAYLRRCSSAAILSRTVRSLACSQQQTIAVAESCTGGMLAQILTSTPGSSVYFLGGVVAYANAAKERILRVQRPVLSRYGAVSMQTAAAMADGIRKVFSCELAVATTGIAGPSGATADKPVGLVFIAVATAQGTRSERYYWRGTRTQIRKATTIQALQIMTDVLSGIRSGRSA